MELNKAGLHLLNLEKAPSQAAVFNAAQKFTAAVENGSVEEPTSKTVVTVDGHKYQCYYNSTGLTVKYSGALAPQNMLDLSAPAEVADETEESEEE